MFYGIHMGQVSQRGYGREFTSALCFFVTISALSFSSRGKIPARFHHGPYSDGLNVISAIYWQIKERGHKHAVLSCCD